MSEFIHKNHNVSVLMYHIVCPTKYRRAVIAASVDAKLKEVGEQKKPGEILPVLVNSCKENVEKPKQIAL